MNDNVVREKSDLLQEYADITQDIRATKLLYNPITALLGSFVVSFVMSQLTVEIPPSAVFATAGALMIFGVIRNDRLNAKLHAINKQIIEISQIKLSRSVN